MSDPCWWCGAPITHYMTHVCKECECFYHESRDPYEPQLGSWVELEWNPECPVHKESHV